VIREWFPRGRSRITNGARGRWGCRWVMNFPPGKRRVTSWRSFTPTMAAVAGRPRQRAGGDWQLVRLGASKSGITTSSSTSWKHENRTGRRVQSHLTLGKESAVFLDDLRHRRALRGPRFDGPRVVPLSAGSCLYCSARRQARLPVIPAEVRYLQAQSSSRVN
jgi:hypothetical protein